MIGYIVLNVLISICFITAATANIYQLVDYIKNKKNNK